jgi:membrane-associated phospholipid phosphatase
MDTMIELTNPANTSVILAYLAAFAFHSAAQAYNNNRAAEWFAANPSANQPMLDPPMELIVRTFGLEVLTQPARRLLADAVAMVPIFWVAVFRPRLIIKMMRLHTMCMVSRGLCMLTTLLPRSDSSCHISSASPYTGGCYDKMPSGHTMALAICLMQMPMGAAWQSVAVCAYAIFAAFVTVGTRSHYTMDVVVSWLLVLAVTCVDRNHGL